MKENATMVQQIRWIIMTLAWTWAGPAFLFAGGPSLLPPPGPISESGRFGPRTAIRAADLPLTITQSGSYYLAENITTAGAGILIDADNVTIDLMGFSLVGGTGNGISVGPNRKTITVLNGSVTGWSAYGVNLAAADNTRASSLHVFSNGTVGLSGGRNGIISDCTAAQNTQNGIVALAGSTITRCVGRANGFYGIATDVGCTVVGCSAYQNGRHGIQVGNAGTIVDCTARENGLSGIQAIDGTSVEGCTTSINTGHGIEIMNGRCLIRNNNCDTNGFNGDGAGIYAGLGVTDNRIEGNNVIGNDRGIDVEGTGNIIIGNTASGNTGGGTPSANFDIAAGNHYGQIVSGPGAGFSNSNPWANFDF